MYVRPNFKTKKALKEALAAGRNVEVFQPNNVFGVTPPDDGIVFLEGPHAPEAHTWYAQGTMKDGKLATVK